MSKLSALSAFAVAFAHMTDPHDPARVASDLSTFGAVLLGDADCVGTKKQIEVFKGALEGNVKLVMVSGPRRTGDYVGLPEVPRANAGVFIHTITDVCV